MYVFLGIHKSQRIINFPSTNFAHSSLIPGSKVKSNIDIVGNGMWRNELPKVLAHLPVFRLNLNCSLLSVDNCLRIRIIILVIYKPHKVIEIWLLYRKFHESETLEKIEIKLRLS